MLRKDGEVFLQGLLLPPTYYSNFIGIGVAVSGTGCAGGIVSVRGETARRECDDVKYKGKKSVDTISNVSLVCYVASAGVVCAKYYYRRRLPPYLPFGTENLQIKGKPWFSGYLIYRTFSPESPLKSQRNADLSRKRRRFSGW